MSGHERREFGVICDRTPFGLGKALMTTCATVERAFELAKSAEQECLFTKPHEHEVKVRLVRTTDWSNAIWSSEHVGGCNESCTPTTHYLKATDD